MKTRPPITPQQTFTMIWRQKNNVVSTLPKNILHYINFLAASSHALKDIEEFEKLKFYISRFPDDPFSIEELRNKRLFLLLESDGKNSAGDIVMESGIFVGHVHIRNVIRYFSDSNLNSEGVWNSSVAHLQHHIASGNTGIAKFILQRHPELIMQRGYAIAPTGDLIYGLTPFELGLCVVDDFQGTAIDPHENMLSMLGEQLINYAGEEEMQNQAARFLPYIEQIGKEEPYQFRSLIAIVKKSTPEEVAAALAKDFNHNSELRNALAEFRRHFPLRIITRGLLCNYATIFALHKIWVDEFEALYQASGNNYDMCRLVERQIKGLVIHRRLAACERNHLVKRFPSESLIIPLGMTQCRHFEFLNDEHKDNAVGAGWDYSYGLFGSRECLNNARPYKYESYPESLEKLFELKKAGILSICSKNSNLAKRPCIKK